ncbi:hypothetical protein FOMPIDRAFT_1053539 [Fomitopsis schrenkii]|uniref:Uncharacterized protein n=1 Tax=Fomitopsis schrenkii TaxID=2126942 RepID=S8F334_FOMSC|nr:hypothetical protein FOMPIDRAFT_1053539 [Fomitopsis schrenkii]
MSNDVVLYSVDISDPRLVYEPAEAWGHFCTQTAGSSVTFKFNGTYVAVYGSPKSSGTRVFFALDHQSVFNYTSSGDSQNIPLYSSSPPLSNSLHTLTFTTEGTNPLLCLHGLQYTGTPDPSPPASTQSSHTSSITASSNHLSSGAVGGIVIGVVIVVLIIVFTVLYAYGWLPRWCRRSSCPSREERMDIVLDDMPKSPPPVGMDAFRKLLVQNAQNAAMIRLGSGPNSKKSSSKKSSSNRTQSTAIFSSVVILTPPVSSSGGSHGRSDLRPPPRALRPQRPTTPILSLHVTN